MFDNGTNEILEIGKRIRRIRKKDLHCTQNDLSSKDLTREMISMLENSSRKLSLETAKILANNMNKYADNNKIVFSTTAKDLMKNEIEQAHDLIKHCSEHINILIKSDNTVEQFLSIYNKAKAIFSEYTIEYNLIFEFYMVTIDYCLDNHLLIEAKECIFKCIAIMKTDAEKLSVFVKLIKILHYIPSYDDIIYISNFTIDFYNKNNFNDVYSLQRIYYNLALAYKDKGYYDNCYEIFDIVNSLNISFLNFDILYANCLFDNEKYREAEIQYNSILSKAKFINDSKVIFRIQQNLALLYLKIGEMNKSVEYIQLALKIKCHKTGSELSWLYYFAFVINLNSECGNFKLKHSFDEAIMQCETAFNQHLQIKLFNKMVDYYIKHKYDNDIFKIIERLEKNVSNQYLSNEKYFHIFNKVAKYFLENNQVNNANIILHKSMNLSLNFTESDLF